MAVSQQHIQRALAELSGCIGSAPPLSLSPAGCAELLQAVVVWAAPGSEPENKHKVPERAAAAARACLRLLEAVRISSRDKEEPEDSQITCYGAVSTNGATPESAFGIAEAGLKCAPQEENGTVGKLVEEDLTDNAKDDSKPEGLPTSSEAALDSSRVWPEDPQCILRCATAPILILCGAHSLDRPWTNDLSRTLTAQLLRKLIYASNCDSVTDLLRGPSDRESEFGTFREVLRLLRPRLCKETWQSHPDAPHVFSWVLSLVPRPWLPEFLSQVLPPALLLSDDYKPENKVLGISCLRHIIRNVPSAELRQYNRALVVYQALRNHLYATDADVIEVALPCLLDLFPVLHKRPPAVGEYQKDGEDPSDQVMQLVLTHMEMEHKIALRRSYARYLPSLQERLGMRVVRHMKRLLRVIVGYLEVCDGPEETTRLCILETLQGTIKYAWPRIPHRLPLLLKALLKLMYDVTCEPVQTPEPVTEALLCGATECLLLLDRCCDGQVKAALKGVPSLCAEPRLVKCLAAVQQDS
ncbi:TELO2-interacting protein 2-like [Spea bombifrons]|uniref:TELO2-interacting protein 2-like n=1 Tax=Spea bombifrons TaxID=233779 RepID=UPI0023497AE6|nr:TELO2-interacting protein 2-like [Spea bombifrons]